MAASAKRRIGTFSGWFIIICAAIVDIIQIILDFFAIGLVANRIIDIFVASSAFFILTFVFKASFTDDSTAYLSLAASITGEVIPFLDTAPLWTLDAWYIVRSIQKKDAALITQKEAEIETREALLARQIAERDYRLALEEGTEQEESDPTETDISPREDEITEDTDETRLDA